jgi:hypothetical protein
MDWYLLLTPLAVLVVLVPFVFVGCEPFGEAEGPPADVTLYYGTALVWIPQGSAQPVSTRRIRAITVEWTLLPATSFNQPAPETKGSLTSPLDVLDVPFVLRISRFDPKSRATGIDCSCVLLLDDQSTVTTKARAELKKNWTLSFRLRRGMIDPEEPATKFHPPFGLSPETVAN